MQSTLWLIQLTSLVYWLVDWLTDLLTDLLTDWLTDWLFDWLTETVMGRLVDCCWPMLLNLQANVLTTWVLPVLCHFFLTNWWCGWLVDDQFRLSLPLLWLNEYRVSLAGLLSWLTGLVASYLTDWLTDSLENCPTGRLTLESGLAGRLTGLFTASMLS